MGQRFKSLLRLFVITCTFTTGRLGLSFIINISKTNAEYNDRIPREEKKREKKKTRKVRNWKSRRMDKLSCCRKGV